QNRGVVEVRHADVGAGSAAVLVVHRDDLGRSVFEAGALSDGRSQRGEGEVRGNLARVVGAVVVLDFLEVDEVGGFEDVDDLPGDSGEVRGGGVEVLNVVLADGDALAGALGRELRRAGGSSGRALDLDAGGGEDAVE